MRKRNDPWDARFGFFWYNDREIFHWAERDYRNAAAEYARSNITHVITFSCTHFRWSFRPWWPQVNEALSRIVAAFHAEGIAVVEHHSSHLTFNPLDADDEEFLARVLEKRRSSISSWPGLREYCDEDPVIGGVRLSEFRQIDGRTGEPARTSYHGYAMCFNNPNYRRAYLSYLETVYATGVDGIMTDDVQYFALESYRKPGHACACGHCRRLFHEETGFELPPPGDAWSRWHGAYGEESFRAWIEFRRRSVERFHRAVVDHYEALGLELLRPNYVSTAIGVNPTAYALDTLPRLDWIFQENCFSHVIRYSWPFWAVEAAHRVDVAERIKIPPMSMFYPDRPDTTLFAWSLAASWGTLYLATPEGKVDPSSESKLRDFERRHARARRRVRRIADVAFYDSVRNRTLHRNAAQTTIPELLTWAQACYLHNIQFSVWQPEDFDRGRPAVPVLVLNDVAIVTEAERDAIERYSRAGGTVIRTGPESGITFSASPIHPVTCERPGGSRRGLPAEGFGPEAAQARREIAAFLRESIGGRWSMRVSGAPEGVIVTGFVAPELDGLVFHVVDTRGCLDEPVGGSVSHDDPIPSLPPPDLSGARIEVRLASPAVRARDDWEARTSTIRSDGVEREGSLRVGSGDAADIVIDLGDGDYGRYTLIEVG